MVGQMCFPFTFGEASAILKLFWFYNVFNKCTFIFFGIAACNIIKNKIQ
jgi:hypothetical protein